MNVNLRNIPKIRGSMEKPVDSQGLHHALPVWSRTLSPLPWFSRWVVVAVVSWLWVGFSPAPHAEGHEGMDPEILTLTEKLEKEPNRVDWLVIRGQVYRSYGKYEESLLDLERAWLLDPDNIKVLLERSLTLSAMEHDQEAEAALNQLLRRDMGDLRMFALAERAVILARTGRPEAAINDYTVLLGIQPVGEVYLRRSQLLESLDRYEEAAAGYQEGLTVLGDSFLLKKGLIDLRIKQGRYDHALDLIDEQILRAPVKTQWYLQRAEILSRLGQVQEAGKTYEQALVEANRVLTRRQTSLNLLARAEVLFAMGRRADAIRDLNEVSKQSPKFRGAQMRRQQWGVQ